MKKKIALMLIFFLLCVGIATLLYNYGYNSVIPSGVYIGDMLLEGLTTEQAFHMLKKSSETVLGQPIILAFEEYRWTFAVSEHLEIDIYNSIHNVKSYLNSGNLFERFIKRQQLKKTPLKAQAVIKYNEAKLGRFFYLINKTIMLEPVNAFFEIHDNFVQVVEDLDGRTIDEHQLKRNIQQALFTKDEIVKVPVKNCKAKITKEDLLSLKIETKIAEFATEFDKSQTDRTENIKIACESINNHILQPNEVFSFNEIVGERTKERGYKMAPVFIGNEVVPDIGGGICQVSSTLYNLALLTDLEIIERVNHSLPVSYVPLGRDATVSYNAIDLKFRNNSGGYLLLATEIIEDGIRLVFFGSEEKRTSIELFSKTVKTISPPVIIKKDPGLLKGKTNLKKGNVGYVVHLWKNYTNGDEKSNTLVSVDTYNPTPTILYVGEMENPDTETNEIMTDGDNNHIE